jgi:uncharacterized protein YecE (DUF72 family)
MLPALFDRHSINLVQGRHTMNSMEKILVGTCGWSYKDWEGHFYPKGVSAGEYLSYYSERFPIVEVDSTFYGSPRPQMVQGWRDKTPESFKFSLKVPQTITHEKLLVDCQKELEEFLSAVRLLGGKLLCCVLQFGFFNSKVLAGLNAFLDRLGPFLELWPKDIPLAVEIRNKYWMKKQFSDFLRTRGVTWVLADQAWMPMPEEILRKLDAITGPFGYLRLLGDRKAVDDLTPTLNKTVIDRREQIQSDARAAKLLSIKVPVVVFVNNHFAGYAHDTVRELVDALEETVTPF